MHTWNAGAFPKVLPASSARPPLLRPPIKTLPGGSPDLVDAWKKAAALVAADKAGKPKSQAVDGLRPGFGETGSNDFTQAWLTAAVNSKEVLTQEDVQSWLSAVNSAAASPADESSSTQVPIATPSSTPDVGLGHQEDKSLSDAGFKAGDTENASLGTSSGTTKELSGLELLKAMADTQKVDKKENAPEVDSKPKVARGGYAMVSSTNRAAHLEDPTKVSSVSSSTSKLDGKQTTENQFLLGESFLYLGKIPMGIGKSLILAECTKYGEVSCIHYDAEAADLFEGGWALVKYAKHDNTATAVGRLSKRAVLFGSTEKIEVRLGTREDAMRLAPAPEPERNQPQADTSDDGIEALLRNASEHVSKASSRQQGVEKRQQAQRADPAPDRHQEDQEQEKRVRLSSRAQSQHSDQMIDRHHDEGGREKRTRHSNQSHQQQRDLSTDRHHDEPERPRPRQRTFREHDDKPEQIPVDRDDREQRGRGRRRRHEEEPPRERRRRHSNTEAMDPRSRSARGGRGDDLEVSDEASSLALAIPPKPRKATGFHAAEEEVPTDVLPVLANEPTGGKQVGVRGCWAEFAVQDNRSYWVNIITGEKTSSRPHSYDNTVRTGAAINRDMRDTTTNMQGMGRGHSNVFVGSLPVGLTELQFQALFERFGTVTAVKLVPEAHYGFVKFGAVHHARAAIEGLNGYVLCGQQIQCKFANMDRNYY